MVRGQWTDHGDGSEQQDASAEDSQPCCGGVGGGPRRRARGWYRVTGGGGGRVQETPGCASVLRPAVSACDVATCHVTFWSMTPRLSVARVYAGTRFLRRCWRRTRRRQLRRRSRGCCKRTTAWLKNTACRLELTACPPRAFSSRLPRCVLPPYPRCCFAHGSAEANEYRARGAVRGHGLAHECSFTRWQHMSKKRAEVTTLGVLQLRKSSLGTVAEVVSALQVGCATASALHHRACRSTHARVCTLPCRSFSPSRRSWRDR